MNTEIDRLRRLLTGLLRQPGATLDEYARLRVELDDHERAERVAAVVRTVPAPPALRGGGLHLLK